MFDVCDALWRDLKMCTFWVLKLSGSYRASTFKVMY